MVASVPLVRAIQYIVHDLGKKAGIRRNVSPHSFRHSLATIALSQDTSIVVVASVLRHAKLETTRKYTKLVDTQRRVAVDKLGVLFPRELLEAATATDDQTVPPANAGEAELRTNAESPVISASECSCVQGRLDEVSTATVGGEGPASMGRSSGASKRQGSLPEPSSMSAVAEKPSSTQEAWPPWSEASGAAIPVGVMPVSSSMFVIGIPRIVLDEPPSRTGRRSTEEAASSLSVLAPFAQAFRWRSFDLDAPAPSPPSHAQPSRAGAKP